MMVKLRQRPKPTNLAEPARSCRPLSSLRGGKGGFAVMRLVGSQQQKSQLNVAISRFGPLNAQPETPQTYLT